MQISILNGSFTDNNCKIRSTYPINLIPTFDSNSISTHYLRPSPGIVKDGDGPGMDRGGINWNGQCYRVMGTSLIKIKEDMTYEILGDVGGYGNVTFSYSFDTLAVVSSGLLFYWKDGELTQVTDIDLGIVVDMLWVDGYFMTTDGEYLVVTELNDPTSIDPLKYGSSEADPDPITSLVKIKNEVCVLNRYTTEFFDNVGGENFPFQRIEGSQFQRGTIGSHTACLFMDTVAFLGSGKNEPLSIWISSSGTSSKIATEEIDTILSEYTEEQLKNCLLEVKLDKSQNLLFVHLIDQTLVYDGAGSLWTKEPVWFILRSSLEGKSQYRAKNFVWCYNKWLIGDPTSNSYGHFVENSMKHYDDHIGWEFSTGFGYNSGKGVIVNYIELVALGGRNIDFIITEDGIKWPSLATQSSTDGINWSKLNYIQSGKQGDLNKRLIWTRQGYFSNWRIQKFKGTSESFMSFLRLEVEMEALNV